jgi:flagellar protein FlgJ
MEINALSTQYLNVEHIPFSSGALANGPAQGEGGFAEMLKRVQDRVQPFPGKAPVDKNDKLYELCVELETFLIKNLLKSMRGTVQKTNLIDTGFAGEMYEDMLYDEYAKTFTRNAGLGFAEMAYRDLKGQR